MPGVTGKLIAEKIESSGHPSVHWVDGLPNLSDCVREKLVEGDIVLTLGAGDIWKVGEKLLADLASA
jgi:UDP-N-acetylmuramate--alanine ligase